MGVGSSSQVSEVLFNMQKSTDTEDIEVWISLNRTKQLKYDKYVPAPLNRDPQVTLRHMDAIRTNWKDIVKGTPAYQRYRDNCDAAGSSSPIAFFYDTTYKRLFELYPETRSMFGDNIIRQGKMLVNVVTKLCSINVLSENAKLVPTLEKLAERHVAYGVKPEHYGAMGQALLHAVETCSGADKWNERLRHYWLDVFSLVSIILIAATIKRLEDLTKTEKKSMIRRMMGGKKQAPTAAGQREGDEALDPNALQAQLTNDLVRRDTQDTHSVSASSPKSQGTAASEDRRRNTSTEEGDEGSVKSEGSEDESFSNLSDLDSHFQKIANLEQQLLQLRMQMETPPAREASGAAASASG